MYVCQRGIRINLNPYGIATTGTESPTSEFLKSGIWFAVGSDNPDGVATFRHSGQLFFFSIQMSMHSL
jgi:hypothetical protein